MLKNVGDTLMYDEQACWHCGHCAYVCPTGAIESNGGNITIYQRACVECGACVNECPASALMLGDSFFTLMSQSTFKIYFDTNNASYRKIGGILFNYILESATHFARDYATVCWKPNTSPLTRCAIIKTYSLVQIENWRRLFTVKPLSTFLSSSTS